MGWGILHRSDHLKLSSKYSQKLLRQHYESRSKHPKVVSRAHQLSPFTVGAFGHVSAAYKPHRAALKPKGCKFEHNRDVYRLFYANETDRVKNLRMLAVDQSEKLEKKLVEKYGRYFEFIAWVSYWFGTSWNLEKFWWNVKIISISKTVITRMKRKNQWKIRKNI